MENAYEILGLSRRLSLSEEEVREAFRSVAAGLHPDAKLGDALAFETAGRARDLLIRPAKRLRHCLALEGLAAEDLNRGSIDASMMDWFGIVAELLSRADKLLAKRETLRSALARALIQPDLDLLREEIEALQEKLGELMEAGQSRFGHFDEQGLEKCREEAVELARNLAFLEKWSAQLRERYGRCF